MSFIKWTFFLSDFLKLITVHLFSHFLSAFIPQNDVYYPKYAPDLDGCFFYWFRFLFSFIAFIFVCFKSK